MKGKRVEIGSVLEWSYATQVTLIYAGDMSYAAGLYFPQRQGKLDNKRLLDE